MPGGHLDTVNRLRDHALQMRAIYRTATVLCWGLFCSRGDAHLISSVERLDQGGSLPWVMHDSRFVQVWRDYTFVYRSKPSYLIGGDQILTTYFGEAQDADFKLQLTLSTSATVYLLIDDRVPNVEAEMPWVSALGFIDTGDEAQIEVSGDSLLTTASIYGQSFSAGSLVLFEQNDSSPDGSPAGMYTVAVVPEGGPALTGFAGSLVVWFRRSRRQADPRGRAYVSPIPR